MHFLLIDSFHFLSVYPPFSSFYLLPFSFFLFGPLYWCRSEEKNAWLVSDLGFDAAINYKGKTPEALQAELAAVCPKVFDAFKANNI
jgi:hypothetical protein